MRSNVRGFRENELLTQAELADEAGVSVKTLRRMEHGDTMTLQLESLLRVAAVLGVSPRHLIPALGTLPVFEEAVDPDDLQTIEGRLAARGCSLD